MIHQPLGGARGQATDIEIQAREIKKMKETLIDILVDATGKNRDELAKDIERDFYLSAGQAKEYGLIDEVLPKRVKAPSAAARGRGLGAETPRGPPDGRLRRWDQGTRIRPLGIYPNTPGAGIHPGERPTGL